MRRTRTALIVITLSNLVVMLGFRLWQSMFNNFAVEELGVQAGQIGLIQAVRETPGLMGFLVGMLALVLVEMRIAGLSVILLGAGLFLTAAVGDLVGLLGATLVMSIGFHFFYSSNASAVLLTVGTDDAPRVLGRLNSIAALAAVLGTVFIFATLDTLGYRTLFRIGGIVVMAGGLLLLPFGRQPVRARRKDRRIPLRRSYWLYYALQFLMGSRRHIFTTFAVFLLVDRYQVTAQTITVLFLLNNLIGTYFHQAFGKIVARFGERRVLSFNFSVLTLVFLGYAFIPLVDAWNTPDFLIPELSVGSWVLFPPMTATPGLLILLAFFVVDHILFGFSVAVESYFQKIAVATDEITSNVSVGQTINHIAAVAVPILGGLIWEAAGARYTFLAGAIVVLVSLGLTRYMRTLSQQHRSEITAPVS